MIISAAIYCQPVGVLGGGGGGECDPYTRESANSITMNLTQPLTRSSANSVTMNLCEEMS